MTASRAEEIGRLGRLGKLESDFIHADILYYRRSAPQYAAQLITRHIIFDCRIPANAAGVDQRAHMHKDLQQTLYFTMSFLFPFPVQSGIKFDILIAK